MKEHAIEIGKIALGCAIAIVVVKFLTDKMQEKSLARSISAPALTVVDPTV